MKKDRKKPEQQDKGKPKEEPPEPKDMVDGIPDRSLRRTPWVVIAVLVVFGAWVAFLLWVVLAGGKG